MFTATQPLTGLFGGLGYIAAFGLLGHTLSRRTEPDPSLPIRAITAVGRRSLSCYLAQSVLFAPLLSAWGFGLGAVLGSAATALIALTGWLVAVVGAHLLEQSRRPGPAETVLRKLSYGRTATMPTRSR